MKYLKTIFSVIVGTLLVWSVAFGSISHVQTTDTIGTLRTTTNNIIDSIQNTTSSLGLFASLASTTGNLIVGSSTQWRAMIVGANGKVLTASSTAAGGLSWESSGAGITSLNGSTSSTQTFATSGPLLSISTTNGVHTFTTLATSSLGLQSVLSFPLSYASTTHISFPIPYASTTGFSFATSGASGLQIASSSGQWTFSQTQSSNGVSGFLSGTDWTTFNSKQPLITFPIPVASTSLSANTPLSISGNILSVATATASINGILTSTDWSTFNGKSSTTINGLSGAITGASLFNTTTTLSGSTYISVTNGGVGATTINLNITPVSSTRAINAGSNLLGGGDLSADRTLYWNASVSTGTITTATSTDLGVTNLHFAGDNTILKTAFKDIGFNVYNATTSATATTTVQKLFYQASTIKQIDCFTNGSSITITADKRASSTPDTAGTAMLGSFSCTSAGVSTSTITSSTISALQILNFNLTSVPNSTTTLRVNIKYSQD